MVDGTGTLVQAAQADPAGRYRVDGLATDNYLVVFVDPRGVNATEFFSNQSDPALANQVVVTSGGSAALVNAFLQP